MRQLSQYSSYPQIGWNEYQGHSVEILGHTLLWTGIYENNHVEWGSLTAGLSRLADQQEQHSIEMSTDNYNKGTYILHNTNSTKRMWEGTVVKAEMVAHNVWSHDVLWRCSKINQTWDISKSKPLEISLPPVPWKAWIIKMADVWKVNLGILEQAFLNPQMRVYQPEIRYCDMFNIFHLAFNQI